MSYDNLPDISFRQLQFIPFKRLPGSLNMAIDHFLSENCQQNDQPILRFYGWNPYCVSIGYHQTPDLIDYDKLKQNGIDFTRRPTGGRAIFHATELTYSIICSKAKIHHKDLYQFFHQILANALLSLGYKVNLKTDNEKLGGITQQADDFPCFTKSAQTEVQYADKKLIGSAQKIYNQAILQHGSLLIGDEHQRLTEFLKVSYSEKKMIEQEIKDKTICLNQIKKGHINQEKIIESIINQLELVRGISVNSRTLTQVEIESAKEYEGQFGNLEWDK